MKNDEKRLVKVLEELERLTRKQISLKFAFLRGIIYGLGTVVGATVLLAVLSSLLVWIFGESMKDSGIAETLRNLF